MVHLQKVRFLKCQNLQKVRFFCKWNIVEPKNKEHFQREHYLKNGKHLKDIHYLVLPNIAKN